MALRRNETIGTARPKNRNKAKQGRPLQDASDRQADILAAASALFLSKGYARTTLRDIADQARVNVALIHYYFLSKQVLYQTVLTEELDGMFGVLSAFKASTPTLDMLVLALAEPFLSNHDLARELLLHTGPEDALLSRQFVTNRAVQAVTTILRAMQRLNRLQADFDAEALAATTLNLAWVPTHVWQTQQISVPCANLRAQVRQNARLLALAGAK